ncbi:MAG: tetratricopeptide repeat-containing sensor histidine kinase [Leadbetterella sp.]
MWIYFLSTVFSILTLNLLGQNPLEKEKKQYYMKLKGMKEDTNKVLMLIEFGQWFEQINMDSASKKYIQAGKLSDKLKYQLGRIKFRTNYTYYLNVSGRYEEALKLNLECLEIAKLADNQRYIGASLTNIGTSYSYLGRYKKAIEFYQTAIRYFDKNNDKENIARHNNILGDCYTSMTQNLAADSIILEKALMHLLKAAEGAKTIGDTSLLAESLVSVSIVYNNLAEPEKAIEFAKSSLVFSKISKNTNFEADAYFSLGISYRLKKEYKTALSYFEKAIEIFQSITFVFGEIQSLKEKALVYSNMKAYEKAIHILEKSITIAESKEMDDELAILYESYGTNLIHVGNIKKGLFYQNKGKQMLDSLKGTSIKKEILALESEFENEKKERKILELQSIEQKQNTLFYGLLAGVFVLCSVGFIGYRNLHYRNKISKQEIIQLKQKQYINATEFILKGQEEERSRLAKDLHDGLGGILSGIKYSLNTMTENMIIGGKQAHVFIKALNQIDLAINEMRRVAHSMMPEALLKFGLVEALQDFCSGISNSSTLNVNFQSFGLEKRLEQSIEITIYRIIQELINNSVKHSQASEIFVMINLHSNLLNINVEDNGVGFDIKDLEQNKGMGISNVESRVAFFNGKLDIQSSIGKGTLTVIEIEI